MSFTSLRDRVVLITGSTSGIGLGLAWAFAREGANLMLHGLGDHQEIERIRGRIAAETGVMVGYDGADLRLEGEAARLVNATEAAFGRVDILVNNAGVQWVAAIDEFPAERWADVQEIALGASFHTIRTALPGMKQRGWGRILNLVSVHGLVASPFKSAYVAAKHGQIGLTRSVARRFVEVDEIAALALFLCTEHARSITGAAIPIDGGWTAR